MANRNGRNRIPPVNPNPRPPNEPKPRYQQVKHPRIGVGPSKPVSPVQNPRQGVGPGRPVGGPHKPAGGPGPTPPGSAPAPSPAPAQFAAPIDPRDSNYWKNYAAMKFEQDLAEQNFDVEDAFAKSAFDKEKAAREYQKPLEVQHLREGANVGGTTYSTSTQEGLGNLAQEQVGRDTQALEAYQLALSQRAGARAQGKAQYQKGLKDLLEEATEKQSAGEVERPVLEDEGSLNSPLVIALENRLKGKPQPKKNNKPVNRSNINAPKSAGGGNKGGNKGGKKKK